MNLATLSWRYLWSSPLTATLHLLMLSLGLAAMAFVITAQQQMQQAFERNLVGIDVVVGAKGSPLQLILAGVFHLDVPPGNIPLSELNTLQTHPMVRQVIPLSLGDSLTGFRIVGTTTDYPAHYRLAPAAGRLWSAPMEAVLGARVAQATGLAPGHTFLGTHGLAGGTATHEGSPYTVTGVLQPCACVLDRLVLTDTRSVWKVHDDLHTSDTMNAEEREALEADREVTMALITYRSPLAAVTFPRFVNSSTSMQAASPAAEVARLLSMVGVGTRILEAFGAVLLGLAALSVFVTLWSAVREREPDLALLRMLGAPPRRIAWLLLCEASWLSLLASAVGLLLVGVLLAAMSHALPDHLASLPMPDGLLTSLGWLPLVALAFTVIASLLPAWRAYRMDVLPLMNRL